MSKKKKAIFNRRVFQRILTLSKPYTVRLVVTLGLIILLGAMAAARPYFVEYAIDDGVIAGDYDFFLRMILWYVGFLLVEVVFSFYQTYYSNWLGQSITLDLRSTLFKHVINFKLRYFDQTPVGMFVTRLVSDVDGVAKIFSNGLLTIIADMLKLIVIIIILFTKSWSLALLVLLPIPLLFYATNVFQKVMKSAFIEIRNQVNRINVFVQEHLTGMNIVQIFNRQEIEEEKFRAINKKHMKAHIRTIWGFSIFFPIVELFSAFSIALLLWWGGQGMLGAEYNDAGEMISGYTKGEIMGYSMYISMIYRPIRQLADRFTVLQDGLVNGERVFKLLDENQLLVNEGTVANKRFEGEIEFKNVFFAYDDSEGEDKEWVIKDVSFSIKKGEKVAFVGSTGAGKSSIINLIGRYYPHQKGDIIIDGIKIQDYTLATVRENISVVLQDVFLISDSIYNNITLYDKDISREQVIAATKDIGAHEFIMDLPGGYDYEVGERGGLLSVGQRQLIAFIRAYVHNPEILILDEATSSIDTESEELIQIATEKITEGRTSLIIAHRLSTISDSDKIFVMDKGEIVEVGTHQELLSQGGLYQQMYELQFQEV